MPQAGRRRSARPATALIGELLDRQRAVPAPRRPGRPRPGRQARPARLEAACAKAIAAGDPSYRTVKGILAAGTEASPVTAPAGDGGAAGVPARPRRAVRREPATAATWSRCVPPLPDHAS